MTEIRLLPAPDCSCATIGAALTQAGLSELPSTLTMPPLIPGEPEFAIWSSADGATRATYAFDPVIRLREIDLAGPQALSVYGALVSTLSLLDEAALREYLADEEPRTQLLGIRGAVVLGAFALVSEIEALRIGPDRHVTAAAVAAVDALTLSMLASGNARIEAEQRRTPNRSTLFPRLGDSSMRRLIVVALLDERDASPEDVVPVLRAALHDPAWEVRVAAMLVTVRLGLRALWPDVRAMELPHTSRSGPDRARRDVLQAARKAALDLLADRPFAAPDHPRAAFLRDLRAVVGGAKVPSGDPLLSWLDSLATPPPMDSELAQDG